MAASNRHFPFYLGITKNTIKSSVPVVSANIAKQKITVRVVSNLL